MNTGLVEEAVGRILKRGDATLADGGHGFLQYADPTDGKWIRTRPPEIV